MRIKKIRIIYQLYYSFRNWESKHSYNHGYGNKINNNGTRLASRIQIQSMGNEVFIMTIECIKNTLLHIDGNNNIIIIREGVLVSGTELWIEDNDCLIDIRRKLSLGITLI